MPKRIILTDLKDINGRAFRDAEIDAEGRPILELRKDSEGKPLLAVPRDERGVPKPGVLPEPIYQNKTKELGKDALPTLLKTLYLRKPQLTRNDTIQGTSLFQNITSGRNGVLELDDGVYQWIKDLLTKTQNVKEKDKDDNIIEVEHGVGLDIFGVNLGIVETALDNFERLHESKKE